MNDTAAWWDAHWNTRIDGEAVFLNGEKLKYVVGRLWALPWLIKAKKLDIGCGPCNHAIIIGKWCNEWIKNYKGIDYCETAISYATRRGINVEQIDIVRYAAISEDKYDTFLLLDTLEHIEDYAATAAAIASLSKPATEPRIFGNVPLYQSPHCATGGFERLVDIVFVKKFAELAGYKVYLNHIYGLDGFPYMWFEAKRE
jgi:SAM-dependent methyltransferase